jgi:hypothetical protein
LRRSILASRRVDAIRDYRPLPSVLEPDDPGVGEALGGEAGLGAAEGAAGEAKGVAGSAAALGIADAVALALADAVGTAASGVTVAVGT